MEGTTTAPGVGMLIGGALVPAPVVFFGIGVGAGVGVVLLGAGIAAGPTGAAQPSHAGAAQQSSQPFFACLARSRSSRFGRVACPQVSHAGAGAHV
jgi:hypothetical protein